MKIEYLKIKNIKSFADETPIEFQKGLNIFIGPNAGGKSNLMDILNITILYFFLHTWRPRLEMEAWGEIRRKYFEERRNVFEPINKLLEKHIMYPTEDQFIEIVFSIEDEDIENIENIIKFKDVITEFGKKEYGFYYLDEFFANFQNLDIKHLANGSVGFIIKNNLLDQASFSEKQRALFLYFRYFNPINILIENYNQNTQDDTQKLPRLYPPIAYFSPYRISQVRNLTIAISTSDFFDYFEKYIRNDSRGISSVLEISNYYFAKKLRYFNDDIEKFKNDPEIQLIRNYIIKLGYADFIYKCQDKEKNIYEGYLIKPDGTVLDFSKASSGEKEILNFLLGIFALNVKNGVIIIDEPELHLHPQWQKILLELFYDFAENRGIQFFIVTHSPNFITIESVKNTFRIFSKEGKSIVVVPRDVNEDEKDLFMLVNIFNNTKAFFADKLILVEGDIDLIIYESILKRLQDELKNTEIIEVIEVQQKGGVEKNKRFFEKWEIPTYGIIDKDKSIKDDKIFILKNGKIEDYFRYLINKQKYEIEDALEIAKKIKNKDIDIPNELEEIFKKIITD
jgi:putative ATP-dependent endonuclease of OLD family